MVLTKSFVVDCPASCIEAREWEEEQRKNGFVSRCFGSDCVLYACVGEAFKCHDVLIRHAKQARKGGSFDPNPKKSPGLSSGTVASLRSVDEADAQPLFDPGDIPPLEDADLPLGSTSLSAANLPRENCGKQDQEDGDAEGGEEEPSTEDEDCVLRVFYLQTCKA